MHSSTAGLLALASSASAVYQGFNYASTNEDGSVRTSSDFETYFKTAANLVGTSGFTSARLYTMIQGDTTADPISAIEAAISTNTTLLLGLWCSGTGFSNELTALKSAISTYGDSLASITAGISIGSEDLYRDSEAGIEADAGVGLGPSTLLDYISQVRDAISGTALSSIPLGHVDTWTAWVNSSNLDVADELDWIGMDAYPYFQSSMTNPIGDAKSLFDSATEQVEAVVGSKEVWVTETGWPTSGKTYGDAVASTENAQTYWETVGCPLFGSVNTWWYILEDAGATPSFGVVSDASSTTPLYSLACNSTTSSSNSSSSSASGTATTSSYSSAVTGGSSAKNGTYSNSTTTNSGSSATTLVTASTSTAATATSGSSSSSTSVATAASAASVSGTSFAGLMVALAAAFFAL